MPKKVTHRDFLDKLFYLNPCFRKGEFKIIGKYKGSKTKILVQDDYGICEMLPCNLYKGCVPTRASSIDKTEYLKNQLKELGYKYEIISEVFRDKDKVVVKTPYGPCLMNPCHMLKGVKPSIETALNKTTYFINRARKVHGDVYDYSLVDYKKSYKKVKIKCSKHGVFKQTPEGHLSGRGCEICSNSVTSQKFSDWKQMCPGNPGIFYILRCWNDEEEFYKVGITCNSIKERYKTKSQMPYNFEVIKEVVDYEREKIWNMEKASITYSKEYHYIPDISFGGSLKECFTKVLIDINI